MAETKATALSKKAGPLKTWQWAGVGVAAYGIYYFYKAHQANTAAATTAAGTTADGTTAGAGPADQYGTGSGIYYANPLSTTTSTSTGSTLTLAQFASRMLSQLKNANKNDKNVTAGQITQAVNEYLTGLPISNVQLARQIENIVSPANSLGAEAISQGGLVRPVIFSTNVVTVAHTPSEAVGRAATTVVEQAHVQPTRAATIVAPKGTTANPLYPYVPGFGVTLPRGTTANPLYPYVPGFGVETPAKLSATATPRPKGKSLTETLISGTERLLGLANTPIGVFQQFFGGK